jgi:hypothetical protein
VRTGNLPPRSGKSQRYPALEIWRAELLAGTHGQHAARPATWRLDALWRAACHEQAAAEALADGFPEYHRASLARAAEVLADALEAAA